MAEYNDIYDKDRNLTGRVHRRGSRWNKDEYGLVVCVWVYDGKGKVLLTRRAPEKSAPGTWENSGGAVKAGEDSLSAICRELREESGAVEFTITPVCAYSVTGKNRVNKTGEESFGMLYTAEIFSFEKDLHSEMERVELFEQLPENWTYPEIQPKLLEEYLRRMV